MRHLEAGAARAGRSLAGFPVTYVVTLGLGADDDVGARWVRSWVAPGQPFLAYPSASNHRWLREAGFEAEGDPASIPEQRAQQIADAFGLFGSPERCAARLLQARDEAGIEDVFLFPAHDLRGRLHHAGGGAAGLRAGHAASARNIGTGNAGDAAVLARLRSA